MLWIYERIEAKLKQDNKIRYDRLLQSKGTKINPLKKQNRSIDKKSDIQIKPHKIQPVNKFENVPVKPILALHQQIRPINKLSIEQQPIKPKQKTQAPLEVAVVLAQQRPIKKAENMMLEEAPTEEIKLYPCNQGCGRSFNQKALTIHEKACRKVFQEKRKEFKASQQRALDEMKQIVVVAPKKSKYAPEKKEEGESKQPKFLKESLAFRARMRQNKGEELTEEMKQALKDPIDDLIKCGGCGRKFNQNAAEKHIPNCEKKNRKK